MSLPFSDAFQDGQWNSAFFDTIGDESGSTEMCVDGSTTPVDFAITAPNDAGAERDYYIHRMTGIITVAGKFSSGGFGDAATPLTNGMTLWVRDPDMNERLMTNQVPIQKNVTFAAYCYDLSVHTWGLGDEALTWRFTMSRDGAPFWLRPGWSLIWRISDNLPEKLTCMRIRAGMVSVNHQYTRIRR